MSQTLRDPRYIVPFAVLIAVTVISLALTQVNSSNAGTPSSGHPTPTAAATAAPVESAADAGRRADLSAIAKLLETYKSRSGAYPTTELYFATLCQRAFDAGCLLTTISKDLPVSDGTSPYWYRSDGQSYTLFATVDATPEDNNCPSEQPAALAGKPVLCLNSPGGSR